MEPKIWFRASKNRWYVTLQMGTTTRQVNLGADKEAAFRRYHQLMIENPPAPTTIGELGAAYLKCSLTYMGARTYQITEYFIQKFCHQYKVMNADRLTRMDVEKFINGHPQWNHNTQSMVKTKIVRMMNWAVEQDILKVNPIRGIRKPPTNGRDARTLIEQAHYQRLIDNAEPHFRDVLITLWETGARPGEVTSVTADEFSAEQGQWRMTTHKTAHKGKVRTVYLTPAVTQICERLSRVHPDGPLYRTQRGTPYGHCGLSKRMGWLTKRLGLPTTITPYGFRHTFATDALMRGIPDAHVAELLGHSGTATLHRHYSHLMAKSRTLKDALNQVR